MPRTFKDKLREELQQLPNMFDDEIEANVIINFLKVWLEQKREILYLEDFLPCGAKCRMMEIDDLLEELKQ